MPDDKAFTQAPAGPGSATPGSAPSSPPAPAATRADPLGIGRYRLLAELGRGGMADVYLAMTGGPAGFSKLLVIKQLRVGDDPGLVSMFLDEARLAARVSHPNIVQTFEVVHEHGRAFMVMEFLDGPSLSRLRRAAVRKGARVPLGVELKILTDALLGLHYAHELKGYDGQPLNVVHRDFTPQNLITTYAGEVKIVDFGIAKAVDQQTQTSAGVFKGKLTYVPPEQLMGHPVDRRADIFAAGVLLYEAVTGETPWKGLTNAAITHALASGRIPRLLEERDAPPELAAICDQAMAVDPDDRYATADELRMALQEFIAEQHLKLERDELGAYVTSVLGEVREQSRHIIDEQLKQATSLPSADTLVQALPTLDGLTPAPQAKVIGRSLPELMSSDQLPDTGQDRGGLPPRRSAVPLVLGALVLVLASALAFVLLRPAPAPAPVPTTAPATVSPTPAPVPKPTPPVEAAPIDPPAAEPPPAPKAVVLRVQTTPKTAKVTLDGQPVTGHPPEAKVSQDGDDHELLVTAPGYTEVRRAVRFERDLTLDVTLAKVTPGAHPARPPPAPKEAPRAPEAPAEAKPADDPEYFQPAKDVKKPPKRPIDQNIEFH